MSDKTGIEWTDATWNPIVGCSVVSPGCTNCYAMKMARRLEIISRKNSALSHYIGTTQDSKVGAVWTGKVALAPDKLFLKPLSWKQPRRIFVNSMGDLFHESIPDEWIERVFEVMRYAKHHTFQVLTKRAERMRAWVTRADPDIPWPLPNVWFGVSIEDQKRADERIPDLLMTPAAVRFVSCEPLLGPIDIDCSDVDWMKYPEGNGIVGARLKIDWVICGGESGPRARPMHPQWVRDLRDQCELAKVPLFFKQWGAWEPRYYLTPPDAAGGSTQLLKVQQSKNEIILHASEPKQFPVNMVRVGKKAAGAELDGETHREFPEVRT